jgi:pSer/pThr/pTyr-binding forkhead associated (FHA) protein
MSSVPQAGPLALFSVAAGPRYGEQIPVPQPVVVIGRGAGCDVVVDDDSVSAEHARLEFDLGAWRITDLGSTNGTAVEGVKLAPNVPTPLPYGTTVRLGGVRFNFEEVPGADPGAARESFAAPPPPATLKEERRGVRFPLWLAALVLLLLAVLAYVIVDLAAPPPEPVPVPAPAAPAARAP